eukprot:6475615-Amphidinium_carterae.1
MAQMGKSLLMPMGFTNHDLALPVSGFIQVGANSSGTSSIAILTSSCGGRQNCAMRVNVRIAIGAAKLRSDRRIVGLA